MPVPAPAGGALCTTSRSPPSPGPAQRRAHPSGAANATRPPRPTRCPLRPPDFPGAATRAQPWNPEPLAGNDNQCAQPSAVTINANTNADNPTTPAVLLHLGTYIPHGVPDTFGFNEIDTSQCTGDTVALRYPSGISGLGSAVKLRYNGKRSRAHRQHRRLSEPSPERATNARQEHPRPRAVYPPAIRTDLPRSTRKLSVAAAGCPGRPRRWPTRSRR